MNTLKTEINKALKQRLVQALMEKENTDKKDVLALFREEKQGQHQKAYPYHLKKVSDNLYEPMDDAVQNAYSQGSGGELQEGREGGPAKMSAVRSSSAMTYNLFRNQVAIFCGDDRIGNGTYTCRYEEQERTLKGEGQPANFDAFLYCEQNKELVVCEMKLMEWLDISAKLLRDAYFNTERYRDYENPDAAKLFTELAGKLKDKQLVCTKIRYDAAQMFKHTLACYNACVFRKEHDIRKLTLLNCVCELPETVIPNQDL